MRIPDHAMQSVNPGAGATPIITLAAPGASTAYVIDRIRSRLIDVAAGIAAPQVRITDSIGLKFIWQLECYVPAAGQAAADDLDMDDLGLQLAAGSAFTADWSGAAPAGSQGYLSVTYHLEG